MLRRLLRALFGPPPPARKPFDDPLLGRLVPDESGWTVEVGQGERSFQFLIGGSNEPDPVLLEHAREILQDFETFERSVRDYIDSESRDDPPALRAELANLKIENISLCWPDRPEDGMIFFRRSENDIGLWRCDYIARKPTGLGCDT